MGFKSVRAQGLGGTLGSSSSAAPLGWLRTNITLREIWCCCSWSFGTDCAGTLIIQATPLYWHILLLTHKRTHTHALSSSIAPWQFISSFIFLFTGLLMWADSVYRVAVDCVCVRVCLYLYVIKWQWTVWVCLYMLLYNMNGLFCVQFLHVNHPPVS